MNTIQNGTFSVIHSSTAANFTNYMYGAVYCNATASVTVNGTLIACQQGQTIPLIVKSDGTIPSTNLLLLGNLKPAGLEKTGKISGTTYQFIDIKTGLPIQES